MRFLKRRPIRDCRTGEIANEWIYSKKYLSSPGRSCGEETDKIEAKLERSGIAAKDKLGAGKWGRSYRKSCVNDMGGGTESAMGFGCTGTAEGSSLGGGCDMGWSPERRGCGLHVYV